MTVGPNPRNQDSLALDAAVTKLTAAVAATKSTAHGAAMAAALDKAQRELVLHYLDVGRLSAANILSTMT